MDDISLLLQNLGSKGVKLWVDGSHIRFHPRSVLTQRELDTLRSRKADVIAHLGGLYPAVEDTAIATRHPEESIPLTFQQSWLWMLRAKTRWHFPMGFAVRIRSQINDESLRASLCALLERHESLRTRITLIDGVPHQIITEVEAAQKLEAFHLPEAEPGDQDVATRQLVESIDARYVDPQTDPVFRATLISRSVDDHVLSIALDHLVADGLSVAILLRDLWLGYMRHATAGPNGSSTSSGGICQYPDYAIWQHRTAGTWDMLHGRYWSKRLEGAERVHPPRENIAADIAPGSFEAVPVEFGLTLSNRLRTEAQRLGTTVPLSILAMYAALLSRWSGQSDFIVPFNGVGRHAAELDNTIGYFAHVLHLRIQLKESDTLLDLLQRVVGEYFAASEHQDFARVVTTRPEFIEGTWFQFDPAFPIGDSNTRTHEEDWLETNLKLEPFTFTRTVPEMKSEVDIVFHLSESPQGFSGTCTYRTDLFSRDTIGRFLTHLRDLVNRLLEEPHSRVTTLSW